MRDWRSITVSISTHLIFRYHLPLKLSVLVESGIVFLHILNLENTRKVYYAYMEIATYFG